jgi:hypothetical protein
MRNMFLSAVAVSALLAISTPASAQDSSNGNMLGTLVSTMSQLSNNSGQDQADAPQYSYAPQYADPEAQRIAYYRHMEEDARLHRDFAEQRRFAMMRAEAEHRAEMRHQEWLHHEEFAHRDGRDFHGDDRFHHDDRFRHDEGRRDDRFGHDEGRRDDRFGHDDRGAHNDMGRGNERYSHNTASGGGSGGRTSASAPVTRQFAQAQHPNAGGFVAPKAPAAKPATNKPQNNFR